MCRTIYWNVWHIKAKRWTNGCWAGIQQNEDYPFKLTLEQATAWCDQLNKLGIATFQLCPAIFEVQVLDDFSWGDLSWDDLRNQPTDLGLNANVTVINDHVCPSCKNDKCSKAEKSCWKCGNVF